MVFTAKAVNGSIKAASKTPTDSSPSSSISIEDTCRFFTIVISILDSYRSSIIVISIDYSYRSSTIVIIPCCRFSQVPIEFSSIHRPPSTTGTLGNFFDDLIFDNIHTNDYGQYHPIHSLSYSFTACKSSNNAMLKPVPMHHSLKPNILAAITVAAVLTILIGGAAAFIWYKRRHSFTRRRHPGIDSRLHSRSIYPFALPSPPANTSSLNRNGRHQTIIDQNNIDIGYPFSQRVLQSKLDAAREKMAELEEEHEMQLLTRPVSESDAIQRRLSDTMRDIPDSAPQGDLAIQLQAAREEINLLVRRIDEMNTNIEEIQAFGWGRAGENEPPPELRVLTGFDSWNGWIGLIYLGERVALQTLTVNATRVGKETYGWEERGGRRPRLNLGYGRNYSSCTLGTIKLSVRVIFNLTQVMRMNEMAANSELNWD
ncbi:hypothetical protein R3P38DRAFT_3469606 [Favolaschia claudopus]|uniref:Uncharacterized protein n=1 Tax=Favolaschia claudopus TaxID=2862362 RepID=A0AAW0CP06_9AGAR